MDRLQQPRTALGNAERHHAAVIFLWFKSDKSVGIILAGIWLIQNIGLVIALLGQMSAYLLPLALLLVGVILYFISSR